MPGDVSAIWGPPGSDPGEESSGKKERARMPDYIILVQHQLGFSFPGLM